MIVSHDWRFIFLKTHKTAGTSLEFALSGLCGPLDIITPTMPIEEEALRLGRKPQNYIRECCNAREMRPDGLPIPDKKRDFHNHMPARELRVCVGERIWECYLKVGFVRNPWDQAVSHFFWVSRGIARNRETFRDFLLRRPLRKSPEWEIVSLDNKLVLDFAGRYENLEGDFQRLLIELGYNRSDLALAKAKTGQRSSTERQYQQFYDDETREYVAELHAPLIKAFGYTF